MATLTITNLTASPLLLQDFYATVPASGSITVDRPANVLPELRTLHEAMDAAQCTLSVQYTAAELGSGLSLGSGAPVVAASVQSGTILFRVALAAGGGGSPDDTVIFAEGDMPSNFRIVDHKLFVATAVALSNVTLESELAGAGTQYLTISAGSTGEFTDTTLTASPLVTRSATEGMIVRRSDNGAAVELLLTARPEL